MSDDKYLVKERSDIADIIREYLELKPAGSHSFKALCPFHHEKSPSLHVSQDKQIWHCFGCGEGGDVISFVMKMQGMDFREALEQLALRAGITLSEKPREGEGKRKTVFTLNDQACQFFETILHEHELGEGARAYLKARDIDLELAKKFRIGFAPKSWDALIRFFGKRGMNAARLTDAGLAKKGKQGDSIDQFRERVMIPIRDIQGRVLGFTGRAIQADQLGPKYLNTPETDVFKKRAALYGLYEARTAIRLEDKVIIVEGNLDVVSSHRAGVEHIVASSGTALTEEHIIAIKRLTQNILFCFDTDAAGFRAAQKGIQLAQEHGLRVHAIRIPKELGKDPDDVVRNNPDSWKEIVAQPITIMQFYIEEFGRAYDLQQPEGKSEFVKATAKEIAHIQDGVERVFWEQRVADVAHVDIEDVKREVRTQAAQYAQAQKPVQNQVKQVVSGNIPIKKSTSIIPKMPRAELLLWEIICLIAEFDLNPKEMLEEKDIPISLRDLYKKVQSLYDRTVTSADPHIFKQQLLSNSFTPHADHVRALMLKAESMRQDLEHNARVEIERHMASLRQLARDEQKKVLEADIRVAEQQGDNEQLKILLKEYQALIK